MKNKIKIVILIILIFILGFVIYDNYIKRTQIRSTIFKKTEFQLYSEDAKPKEVVLYTGDMITDSFKLYKDTIFESEHLINEIKQILQKLFEFKNRRDYISLIPEGTILREAYLDANNICYIDLSSEIKLNHKGGTQAEFLTIYSIVNTVCYNFPQIKGVKILIDGKEEETLAGHIDISEILLPAKIEN